MTTNRFLVCSHNGINIKTLIVLIMKLTRFDYNSFFKR